ncbi:LOW QUALITY PROTEIN: hypothetical protein TorRG33x02_005300 [Trema orientale]|uniref:Uncharacterized protein n=1 Tax=Trema orientale TaxID=63057 RepID=A0A2P5FZW4_TREOI|nr:LOW QUALITY PROTEIN: hypothetical protein TorRG33x02_005300 [Trema orientale]
MIYLEIYQYSCVRPHLREPHPSGYFLRRFSKTISSPLWIKLVDVIKLNVLILLGNDLCLNFSCGIRCTTNKNENRCACESSERSQVSDLFNHCRSCSQYSQKP